MSAVSHTGRLIVLLAVTLMYAKAASAQQQPAPPPEPPPRLEASAQVTFVSTRGNASAQTLGAGGDMTWRPDPWTYTAKALFAQAETDDELTARSLASLFRASRAIGERLSVYGQYDFLRDVFAGIEQRHVVEGGVSYLVRDVRPHRLRLDAGLGYLYEERPDDHLDSVTLSLGAAYRFNISATSEFTYEPRFLLPFADTGRVEIRPECGTHRSAEHDSVSEGRAYPALFRGAACGFRKDRHDYGSVARGQGTAPEVTFCGSLLVVRYSCLDLPVTYDLDSQQS